MNEADLARAGGPALMSIGHSNHSIEDFVRLLRDKEIEVVADVRSSPYSRYNSQFNRENLRPELRKKEVDYVFLGKELGGKPEGDEFYETDPTGTKDYVLYWRIAQTDLFQSGLARLVDGAKRFRIAMMCSEEDPADCHRYLLITRELYNRGLDVTHIRGDKSIETTEKVAGVDDGTAPWREQMSLIESLDRRSWRSTRPVTRTDQRVR